MAFSRSRMSASMAGFSELRHVAETGSTNDDLVADARAGDRGPVVLVADHQTSGRGRLDRKWVDDGGALLVSFRLRADAGGAHEAMAAVAAAARHAIGVGVSATVQVKWPNDLVVVVDGTVLKLAGLLAEWVDGDDPCVIVGIGINIAPVRADRPSASMIGLGSNATRDQLLASILDELPGRLVDPGGVADEIRGHSATLGRRVRAELPAGAGIVGEAVNLDSSGRLIIVDDDGERHVVSTGDVVHLKDAEPEG